MAKLIYETSSGQLEFGNEAPLLVTKIDGLGSVRTGISTQKSPGQDGVSVTGMTLDPRFITIEGQILEPDKYKQQEIREQMLRSFRPKTEARLTLERYGATRTITCVPEIAPEFPSAMQSRIQPFFLSLICPDPYWQSVTESETEIVTWIGGLTFPLQFPISFAQAGEKRKNIINQGDAETPVRVEIFGPATNPRITNISTGEYMQVDQAVYQEQTLVITTDFGHKRVELDGVSAFNYIDEGTTFFSLVPGDNIIECTSADPQEVAKVKISHRERYLGG